MKGKGIFTKVLAIAGTVLTTAPIVFTIVTSIVGSIIRSSLRVDYLMPAELFPLALVGGLLLLWAAFRARSMRKAVCFGLGGMVVFLAGCQGIAVASGLATGAIAREGWIFILVVASLALYTLSLIGTCVAGILLSRSLFRCQLAE